MNDERSSEASILQCGHPRGDGAAWCDLQNDHGGNMHSGTIYGKRIWWDRKGRAVTFSDSAAGGVWVNSNPEPASDKRERVTCSTCGRAVTTYVPRVGDGSGVVVRSHRVAPRLDATTCDGSYRMVVVR